MKLVCNHCNITVDKSEVWILKDIKNFTARKLLFANCPQCGEVVITLYEKRLSDNKVFVDENIQGLNAVKLLYREKQRLVTKVVNIDSSNLYGWIYGKNIEIKNKKGEVTQVRQYAADYKTGKKNLTKTIYQK